MRRGEVFPPSALLPVGPVLVIPLNDRSTNENTSSAASSLSIFGLGKRTPASSSSGSHGGNGSSNGSSFVSVVPSSSLHAARVVDYTVPLEVACAEGVFAFSVQIFDLLGNAIITGTLSTVQSKVRLFSFLCLSFICL